MKYLKFSLLAFVALDIVTWGVFLTQPHTLVERTFGLGVCIFSTFCTLVVYRLMKYEIAYEKEMAYFDEELRKLKEKEAKKVKR